MKTSILMIISAFLLCSCQTENGSDQSWPDNTKLMIEKIVLNGTDYAIGSNFMVGSGCPLTATGTLASSGRIEVEYIWNKTDEVLSSVSAECGNPTARVEVQQANVSDLWQQFTITISTGEPKADVIYRIAAMKELPSGK